MNRALKFALWENSGAYSAKIVLTGRKASQFSPGN